MKQLKQMKETLVGAVQGQLGNLGQADYRELGAAVDMIKDLSEAIYYCSIVESMKEAQEREEMMMKMGGGQQQQQPQSMMYFQERVREPYYERDMDRNQGRMYYNGGGNGNGGGSRSEPSYTNQNEGRSGQRRRTYMESKKMNTDKNMHIRELEEYAHELTNDILEMVQDASPEEKQTLKKKILELSNKM